jgi:hypothetical protein
MRERVELLCGEAVGLGGFGVRACAVGGAGGGGSTTRTGGGSGGEATMMGVGSGSLRSRGSTQSERISGVRPTSTVTNFCATMAANRGSSGRSWGGSRNNFLSQSSIRCSNLDDPTALRTHSGLQQRAHHSLARTSTGVPGWAHSARRSRRLFTTSSGPSHPRGSTRA